MKLPHAAFDRLLEAGTEEARIAYEWAFETEVLALRLEDLLQEVAPEELEVLRRSLYMAAQTSPNRVPFCSVGPWTPPSKEAA